MRYLYESHLGSLYTSDEYLDYDYLYCDMCGESDWFIGVFNTINEFWNLIEDDCDIYGSGGYSMNYIYPIIVKEFNLSDKVEYKDSHQKDCGFCCNSYSSIIRRIEELIGRKIIRKRRR